MFKRDRETVQKREQYAKYVLAKKRADQLQAVGECFEEHGVIDIYRLTNEGKIIQKSEKYWGFSLAWWGFAAELDDRIGVTVNPTGRIPTDDELEAFYARGKALAREKWQ